MKFDQWTASLPKEITGDSLWKEVVQHRISLLTQIIKLLLTMVPQQRGKPLALREEQTAYHIDAAILLEQIPLP